MPEIKTEPNPATTEPSATAPATQRTSPADAPEETSPAAAERAEFEAALEAEEARGRFKPGDLVHGTVASIQQDAILVSLGGKSDAVMDETELDGTPEVGQPIEAVVVSVGSEVRLSAKMAAERRMAVQLQEAADKGTAVIGRVIARNKGGYHVAVGPFHAFCPLSQIDLGPTPDPSVHLEKSYPFQVLEVAEGGQRIVLSRARQLKEERGRLASQTRAALAIGKVYHGKVTSLTDYGAFVDIGGLEGLVHVSEISHRRVGHPREVLTEGQEVDVAVSKIEKDGKRISLSMKELEADPWTGLAERYPSGKSFSGKILRKTDFGLFVELEPGIDGLVHVSQLPPGVALADTALAPGEMVRGWVREVDLERKRVSLALREVATEDPWRTAMDRYGSGQVVEGQVEKVAPFGAFVLLEPGLSGLIPASEIRTAKGIEPERAYTPGERLAVKVLTIDPERRRISLSAEGAKEEAARGEFRKYVDEKAREEGEEGGSMGTLAAAFKRARLRE